MSPPLVPLATLHWFLRREQRLGSQTRAAIAVAYARYRSKRTTRKEYLESMVTLVGQDLLCATTLTLSRRERSLRRSVRLYDIQRNAVSLRMSEEDQ